MSSFNYRHKPRGLAWFYPFVFSSLLLFGALLPLKLSAADEAGSVANGPEVWPFIVKDIRVEGLQRLPIRVVYTNLPFNTGDVISQQMLASSVKALYRNGKLQDIKVFRSGDTLIYQVNERPSISEINFTGNKVIDTDALKEGLAQAALEPGSVLQFQTLDRIKLELERQYVAQGRYGAKVNAKLTPKPRNRVAIDIKINEGEVAKIEHINIVGNEMVSDETLFELMQLKSTHFWSFFKGDNKYARERLAADLETLSAYYLDRGYINFNIESALVSVSEDQEQVFITINIHEGKAYDVGEVSLSGDLVLTQAELERFVAVQTDQLFSRRKMTLSSDLMSKRLGNEGYTFAQVKGYPELNEETGKVDIRFFVNPGKRTYVRRILFSGNKKTKDEVLRREMRQMEGAWAQANKIQRSKSRLERLGYFKSVQVETPVLSGNDDLVDVIFNVEEQPSGSIGASIGYQGGSGLIFGANVSQSNFLGTGNRVSFAINQTSTTNSYNFRFSDPYYTIDGVSRGFSLFFREADFDEDDNLSNYRTDAFGAAVDFGYPIDEHQRVNFNVGFDYTRVYAFGSSADEVKDFIGYQEENFNTLDVQSFSTQQGVSGIQSRQFQTLFAEGSWSLNKLNRGLLPDRGFSHRISIELALPGSNNFYYKAKHNWQHYFGLSERVALRLRSELGYGEGWHGDDELPFYKHFYAGGFGSVRGYDDNSLGPRDSSGDSFGGNALVEASVGLIVPTPFIKDQRSVRTTFFIDGGNVYNTDGRNSSDIEFSQLRYSGGVSLTWITAIGPVGFSWAIPFNETPDDDVQKFQFTLGRIF